jgi:hypothetical protein
MPVLLTCRVEPLAGQPATPSLPIVPSLTYRGRGVAQVNVTRLTVNDHQEPLAPGLYGTEMARSCLPGWLLASSRPGTPPRVKGGRRPSRSDASGSEHS